jgi:hypothetical protein
MRTLKFIGVFFFLCVFLASPVFGAVMVSNLGESADNYYVADYEGPEAEGFITDGSSYQLTSVTVDIDNVRDSSGNFTLRIFNDNGGLPGTMVTNGLLSGPGNPSVGQNTYTATGSINLSPNTTYWVVAQVSSGTGRYALSFTLSTSQTGAWSILDYEAYSEDSGSTWYSDDTLVMRMSISADEVDPAIPTLNEWGMIIFTFLLALVSIYYLYSRKRDITA